MSEVPGDKPWIIKSRLLARRPLTHKEERCLEKAQAAWEELLKYRDEADDHPYWGQRLDRLPVPSAHHQERRAAEMTSSNVDPGRGSMSLETVLR
jgi:hypothetical protein